MGAAEADAKKKMNEGWSDIHDEEYISNSSPDTNHNI